MLILNIILYIVLFIFVFVEAQDEGKYLMSVTIANCYEHDKEFALTDECPVFYSGEYRELNIYGGSIPPNLKVGITSDKNCGKVSPSDFRIVDNNNHIATMSFTVPKSNNGLFSSTPYFICVKEEGGEWMFPDNLETGFLVEQTLFTPVTSIILILITLSISSIMSGLNIGLFTFDTNELELLQKAGTADKKKHAKVILPVRRSGNFLLCSILITATLCNAISTVSIDRFLPEWITIPLTTTLLVLLCEILPQTICTTYPLFVGAHTIYFTKTFMILTSPISYPLSKILDCLIGKELAVKYDRKRLRELLKMTQLPADEEKIIAGTLDLGHKTVEEIMTLLSDVFKLPINSVMDFETISAILASGYSRIPIYVGSSSNIRYVLLTKDLALLDPDDKVPVKMLVKNTKLKCHYILKTTTLDKLLEIFKDSRNHMVFVVDEFISSDHEDKHVIGLVTFEDILEEIFQTEINDETDYYSDNRYKRKLEDLENKTSFIFKKPRKAPQPSENFKTAISKFLSGIDTFSVKNISPTVLNALLNLEIYYLAPGKKLPEDKIYVHGVPANYFVLILEGQMEISIGSGGMTFEAGAFQYFGVEGLTNTETDKIFIPDYTLQAVSKTKYIKIYRVMYEAAVLATKYERLKKLPNINVNSELYKYFNQLID